MYCEQSMIARHPGWRKGDRVSLQHSISTGEAIHATSPRTERPEDGRHTRRKIPDQPVNAPLSEQCRYVTTLPVSRTELAAQVIR
jgi:hypothetical protein